MVLSLCQIFPIPAFLSVSKVAKQVETSFMIGPHEEAIRILGYLSSYSILVNGAKDDQRILSFSALLQAKELMNHLRRQHSDQDLFLTDLPQELILRPLRGIDVHGLPKSE